MRKLLHSRPPLDLGCIIQDGVYLTVLLAFPRRSRSMGQGQKKLLLWQLLLLALYSPRTGSQTSKVIEVQNGEQFMGTLRSLSGDIDGTMIKISPGATVNVSDAKPMQPGARIRGRLSILGPPLDQAPAFLDLGFLSYASVS